jgi:nitrogen-specific signal transduction histidine kinase
MENLIHTNKSVKLTNTIDLSTGCHIVYTYSAIDHYLENATSYLAEGLENNHVVICIDKPSHFKVIVENLKMSEYSEKKIEEIVFADTDEFYRTHDVFNVEHVFNNFSEVLHPFMNKNKTIRTWGNVTWKEQNKKTLQARLKEHEMGCDCFISETANIISVCAYDASALPSSILCDILKAHEYHMTDKVLAPSNLYKRKPVLFPSISEQIKLEKAAENQLVRSEKLSIAGKLAAGIAHEIRNPITSIKGFLKLIEDEQYKRYVEIIKNEVDKIEQISNEFLILANPHLENRKEINVSQLIESVKDLLEPQAVNKNISIQTEFESGDITIYCDEMKIKQVLINIIKNAIEAMESGPISITVKKSDHLVMVSVTDEGAGFSDDVAIQLGQPFFTTKENGTGLGLLICQKIIEDHKGKIFVESMAEKGTTFTIQLPYSKHGELEQVSS